MDQDTELLFALSFLPGVGSKTILGIAKAGTNKECTDANLPILNNRVARALRDPGALGTVRQQARNQIELARDNGHEIIGYTDERYPRLLRKTPDAPPFLFVSGSIAALHEPTLAIIGSRNPTDYNIAAGEKISSEFARRGFSLVSGLAIGCDSIAHKAALKSRARTVAVLAHGLQTVAPKSSARLAEDILENDGALVSEYPFGVEPRPPYFVARDRIQAGLSTGTIVLQSGLDGGSLHAAQACVRYGRPLAFVSPSDSDKENFLDLVGANQLANSGDLAAIGEMLKSSSEIVSRLLLRLSSKGDYDKIERQLLKDIDAT